MARAPGFGPAPEGPVHDFALRVYYEDTDLAGVVYYANYLRFIERGRSEWLRAGGVDQLALQREGMVFVVRRVVADYLAPARFQDRLLVRSGPAVAGAARIVLPQLVLRGDQPLFRAEVTLACINPEGRPLRIPGPVRRALGCDISARG